MFQGYWAAVVTPFRHSRVDIAAFERYIATLIEGEIKGIVVCGSTGEALSLTSEERISLIKAAKHMAEGRIPIAAGVITTTTRDASQQAKEAEKSGADALLAITPFYIKPSPEGLYNHFYTLHEATSLPIILYNNPGRTGIDLDLNTLEKLMQLPRLMALKEASPHFTRILSWRRHLRSDFSFMAGDDESAPAFLALGGDGIISVTANIAPKLCTELYNAWINADLGTFASIRDRLAPLHRALFMEPNPCPTKYALSVMGIIRDEVRLPLLPVTEPGQFILRRVLQEGLGLDV